MNILPSHKSHLPLKVTQYARRPSQQTRLRVTNFVTPNVDSDGSGKNSLVPCEDDDSSIVFVDDDGQHIPVMSVDYGFRTGGGRLYQDRYGTVPTGAVPLAIDNFKNELRALRRSVRFDEYNAIGEHSISAGPIRKLAYKIGTTARSKLAQVDQWLEGKHILTEVTLPKDARDPGLNDEQTKLLESVKSLQLSDALVAQREMRREQQEGKVDAPWYVRIVYGSVCWILDQIYEGRPIQRFWVLETVARMPYFSYLSMLHLYESLGWWRAGAELRKVHFAEEWNELHHLQIMESLGGDQLWIDRFLAQHAAVFYFWLLVAVFFLSPSASYAFSELVENHAADTYAEFVEQNAELLKSIPPPLVALNYYKAGDLYLFDQFMTGWAGVEPRRPACNNLYDVFVNIRDDELEHIKTMKACKDGTLELAVEDNDRMKRIAAKSNVRQVFTIDCHNDEDCDVDWGRD